MNYISPARVLFVLRLIIYHCVRCKAPIVFMPCTNVGVPKLDFSFNIISNGTEGRIGSGFSLTLCLESRPIDRKLNHIVMFWELVVPFLLFCWSKSLQ